MKHVLVFLVTGWAMIVVGQEPPLQPATRSVATGEAAPESVVPNGVRFLLRMKSAVTSTSANAGDAVNLQLLQDVKDSHDQVRVPRKAKLSAHVVGARAYTKDLDARLSIVVDRAEWEGHSVQLNGVISAVPRYPGLTPTWKGPGGPVGATIGDPAHGIPARTPTDPGNKAEIPVLRDVEGIEIGYLPESQVTVLVSKMRNINLYKDLMRRRRIT
jgi:hypothetical protein